MFPVCAWSTFDLHRRGRDRCNYHALASWRRPRLLAADSRGHGLRRAAGPGTPPTFLAQAEDDGVHVENSIFYYLALKQRGAPPSELHVYPQGGHGYGRQLCAGLEVCQWPERAETFLQTLGVAPIKAAA